jgi:hypothetical protein
MSRSSKPKVYAPWVYAGDGQYFTVRLDGSDQRWHFSIDSSAIWQNGVIVGVTIQPPMAGSHVLLREPRLNKISGLITQGEPLIVNGREIGTVAMVYYPNGRPVWHNPR